MADEIEKLREALKIAHAALMDQRKEVERLSDPRLSSAELRIVDKHTLDWPSFMRAFVAIMTDRRNGMDDHPALELEDKWDNA